MIGEPLRRREDLPLVRGAGRYVDDLARPGLAHVVFVRSHHARARIAGVRTPSSAPGATHNNPREVTLMHAKRLLALALLTLPLPARLAASAASSAPCCASSVAYSS